MFEIDSLVLARVSPTSHTRFSPRQCWPPVLLEWTLSASQLHSSALCAPVSLSCLFQTVPAAQTPRQILLQSNRAISLLSRQLACSTSKPAG